MYSKFNKIELQIIAFINLSLTMMCANDKRCNGLNITVILNEIKRLNLLKYDTVYRAENFIQIISEIKKKYTYKKGDSSSAIRLITVSESIDGKTYYYFESDTIDLNPTDKSVPTKSYTIEVEAKDKAEKPKTMNSLSVRIHLSPDLKISLRVTKSVKNSISMSNSPKSIQKNLQEKMLRLK